MIRRFFRKLLGIPEPVTANPDSGLEDVRKNWDALAKHDPMWAILSNPAKKGNLWENEEFFATGEREINTLVEYIGTLGVKHESGRALDFGCGVGRLAQAMAGHYREVDGVDISDEMVRRAREYNRFGDRVRYTVNTANVLPYGDGSFDLVYSNIVLQHMPKDAALGYIAEFVRVIKPGGLAVFQAPSRCLTDEGTKFSSPIETEEGVRYIDMNLVPREEVEAAVGRLGARMVDVVSNQSAGPKFESYRYCVTKDA